MNLLDDVETYKAPSRAKLTKQATSLVGRRRTKRGKKKKRTKSAKWKKEYKKALADHKQMKKEFERLIK